MARVSRYRHRDGRLYAAFQWKAGDKSRYVVRLDNRDFVVSVATFAEIREGDWLVRDIRTYGGVPMVFIVPHAQFQSSYWLLAI